MNLPIEMIEYTRFEFLEEGCNLWVGEVLKGNNIEAICKYIELGMG